MVGSAFVLLWLVRVNTRRSNYSTPSLLHLMYKSHTIVECATNFDHLYYVGAAESFRHGGAPTCSTCGSSAARMLRMVPYAYALAIGRGVCMITCTAIWDECHRLVRF